MSANLDDARASDALHYRAETASGAVELRLRADAEMAVDDSAALAAVRLAAVETLLQGLDDWLQPLDWRWSPADADRRPAGTVCLGTDEATLHLPWALVRRAGAAPASLRDTLSWPRVEATLLIDGFDLDDREAALLEPGGVVLLPGSFTPGNAAWLATEQGAPVPLRMLGVDAPADSAPPAGDWSVQCALAAPCPLPQAAGWEPFDAPPAHGRPAQLLHRGRLRAMGELIPWGRGRALRLLSCIPD